MGFCRWAIYPLSTEAWQMILAAHVKVLKEAPAIYVVTR